MAAVIADDVAVWAAGVELVTEELAAGDQLPSRIHLCGGGSRLPEIREALAAERFWKRLPFSRPPEVTIMSPDQVTAISDATDLLVDQQDVTPLGLAYQAIEHQAERGPARRRPAPRPAGDEGLAMATPVGLIYLDVDDEITSAANRIRNVEEMRVALVLPAGSRLATSRINFRLLAREAQAHAHDLFIVAPEAATRALAASAGLAVYSTVRELEEAMAAPTRSARAAGLARGRASAVTVPLDRVAPPDRAGATARATWPVPWTTRSRRPTSRSSSPSRGVVQPRPNATVSRRAGAPARPTCRSYRVPDAGRTAS